jgi:hypothetical protein
MSTTVARRRPVGVTILAVLAGIAGFVAVVHTLQYLHLVPFFLGPMAFYGLDLFGAILWAISALIWTWVAANLWYVNPRAWLFVAKIPALHVILAGPSILGASTSRAGPPAIPPDGAAPLSSPMPGVQDAFGVGPTATVTHRR